MCRESMVLKGLLLVLNSLKDYMIYNILPTFRILSARMKSLQFFSNERIESHPNLVG